MEQIRIGLLGGGRFALRRAQYLAALDGVQVTVGWSRSSEHRQRLADQTGAEPVEGWRAVAEDPRVDAVLISTPHVFHAEQATACVAQGKHVLVETPICLEYPALRGLADLAEPNGTVIHHGIQRRYHPGHARQVEELRGIAPLFHAQCLFSFEGGPERPWYRRPELSGGAVGFLPWASSDLIEAFGPVAEADGWSVSSPELESLTMRLRFAEGGLATVTVGTGTDQPSIFTGTVFGEGGILHWGPGETRLVYPRRWDAEGEERPLPSLGEVDLVDLECRAFVEEIRGLRDPAPHLALDLRILQAVSAAREAARGPLSSAQG